MGSSLTTAALGSSSNPGARTTIPGCFDELISWTPQRCEECLKEFLTAHNGVGWLVSRAEIKSLFKLKHVDPPWRVFSDVRARQSAPGNELDFELPLTARRSEEKLHFLHVLSAVTVLSLGTFAEKWATLYKLFDISETRSLTSAELRLAVSSLSAACAAITGRGPLSEGQVSQIAERIFRGADLNRDFRVDFGELLEWVAVDKYAVDLMSLRGTSDINEVKSDFTSVPARRRGRFQQAQQSARRRGVTLHAKLSKSRRFSVEEIINNPREVMDIAVMVQRSNCDKLVIREIFDRKHLKSLRSKFDSIDQDKSGEITLAEYSGHFYTQSAHEKSRTFKALDRDGNGLVTFEELLRHRFRILTKYPPTRAEMQEMLSWVTVYPVEQSQVLLLRKIFYALDVEEARVVSLEAAVAVISRTREFHKYTVHMATDDIRKLSVNVTLNELMARIFGATHSRQLRLFEMWASPKPLTKNQKREIALLFQQLDEDRDGTLSHSELSNLLTPVGLPADELHYMFEQMDLDQNGEVSPKEFERFFRSCWDTGMAAGSASGHVDRS